MKKTAKLCLVLSCMLLFISHMVYAAEAPSVMNAYTESEVLTVFVKAHEQTIDKVYLGNTEAKEYIVDEAGQIRTVIILDNSLSINQKYREDIKLFLTDLVAARNDGEIFTIATFNQDLTYLVQESSDYLDIKAKIEGLEFVNQDSYFTKVLYKVLDDIESSEDVKYTRIIVIADGVDNETFGYTDEELNQKVQAAGIPVYTLGCTTSGSEDNLKKMLALSRLSNAKSYLLDNTGISAILQDIISDNDIIKITIIPHDEQCDGTVKQVRLSFGDSYCLTELMMPFKEATGTVPITDQDIAEKDVEANAEPAEVTSGFHLDKKLLFGLLVAALVLIILIAVACVKLFSKKGSPRDREYDGDSLTGDVINLTAADNEAGKPSEAGDKTEILGGTGRRNTASTGTEIFNSRTIKLCLQDMGDSSKTFEYPVRDKVVIGKDPKRCQIVIDYDKYISSVHCEVLVKEDKCIVRDGGPDAINSTNGTFANGKKVAPEAPLPSGATLRIGKTSFKVSYK